MPMLKKFHGIPVLTKKQTIAKTWMGQWQVYNEVIVWSRHRLRVEIRSDSSVSGCRAHIDRWDGAKWNWVHSIIDTEMKTEKSLAYKPKAATAEDFMEDRNELVEMALTIIE
jgi:hypothetical protein